MVGADGSGEQMGDVLSEIDKKRKTNSKGLCGNQ
jgi:hypothetical protein